MSQRAVRRGALPRSQQALRTPCPPRLCLLSRPARGVPPHLRPGRAGAPDPTCYLASTAAIRSGPAPLEGGDALYVLVHTPYLRPHHDWTKMFPGYRQVILDKLKRTAGLTDIEDRIVYESALTPVRISTTRYRVLNGAIYGISSHGHVQRGIQTGQQAVRSIDGPLSCRRRSPSRTRHANGHDVGLDRC